MTAPAASLAGCRDCGTIQRRPAAVADAGGELACAVCDAALERSRWRDGDAALACSASALLLLSAGNLQPYLTTSVLGTSRESLPSSSATAMFGNGYPDLAIAIALFVVAFPLLRFALLTGVLGVLRFSDWRPRALGRAFRAADGLQTWAMADVFVVATLVAWARVKAELPIDVGIGVWFYGMGAVFGLLARATLDVEATWRAIAPDRPAALGAAATLACSGCGLVVPRPAAAGARCPRCAAALHARKPGALRRAAALSIAGALLYLPANLYPIATLPIDYEPVRYTVIVGVIDLFKYKLYALALIVLVASFIVPLLKLAVMGWCIASVVRRSPRHLAAKARLFHVVEEIGRWSMVDPFAIACFVPVTDYPPLVVARAEAGAPAFTAVVVLTVLAARVFDPRLMRDAAGRAGPGR